MMHWNGLLTGYAREGLCVKQMKWQDILNHAAALGFEDGGVCSALPFATGEDNPFARVGVEADPRVVLPEAQSVLVLVRRYRRFGPWPRGTAEIANYYETSHPGRGLVEELAQWMEERGARAVAHPSIPAKAAALRAGLGMQGRNTQFIHREFGMLVSLHLILTDLPYEGKDSPRTECEGCGLCEAACPTGALADGRLNVDRCLRHHMLAREPVPEEYRRAMGTHLLGCTICQHVCPYSRGEVVPVPPELAAACEIEGLLRGDEEQRRKLAAAIGANYARRGRLMAQAALCAGNSGDRRYVPALRAMLAEEALPARAHAIWALRQLEEREPEGKR